jgi:hypothetical protein
MSGTIKISDDSYWVPAGWVFDNALEIIAASFDDPSTPLANLIRDARTSVSTGYLDLSDLTNAQMQEVARAVFIAVDKERRAGGEAFDQPQFFSGYMQRLEELCAMFAADPRCQATV